MSRSKVLVFGLLVAGMMFVSCIGQERTETDLGITAYLPERLGESGIARLDEVQLFVGDSLYEYINGGAEMYYQYGFVEVATTHYRREASEFVADIYRFADPDNAYGMFSTLRPDHPETVPFGVAGFTAGPTVIFVKGEFIVNLVGYDESPATVSAVHAAADALVKILPGTADLPAMFSLFPEEGRIAFTQRIYAESYLGQTSLSDIYTIDCLAGADTITLFLGADETGAKYGLWSEQADAVKTKLPDWEACPFDNANYLAINNSYYGVIVAGLKSGKLMGIVGYGEKHRPTLTSWVSSFSPDSVSTGSN